MFPTTLQSLAEMCICTRGINCRVLYFSEMKWLREEFEATKYRVHVYIKALHLFYNIFIFTLRALSNWKGKLDVLLDWYEQKLVQFEIFCRCKVHIFFKVL
jgi:hypothetical protein